MKRLVTAVTTFLVAVTMLMQQALAQAPAGPSPVEAFFCNMADGKDMKDLMTVTERFKKWADKNDPDYSAWILTPRFGQFAEMPGVVWLGSNRDGNAMGKGLEKWIASGGDIQDGFNDVLRCGAHTVASSVEINAPDGPPKDGVVMFTQCKIAEGSDWRKAIDAHKKYSASMRALGAKNSNWLFFPMIGGMQDRGFDYWGVSTFNGWSDYFAAYELYVTGGGWQKGMEAMKDAAACGVGSASVWDVKLVRLGAQ